MDEKALFLKFWEKEAPAAREVISRIPQERSDYKPEAKARNARELAWLLVLEEKLLVEGLESGKITRPDVPAPATVQEILDTYDRQQDGLTRRLTQLDHPPGKDSSRLSSRAMKSCKRAATTSLGNSSSLKSTIAASSQPICDP